MKIARVSSQGVLVRTRRPALPEQLLHVGVGQREPDVEYDGDEAADEDGQYDESVLDGEEPVGDDAEDDQRSQVAE